MYVQRKESVHVCFVRDKEADGKQYIDGRPAQEAKLLGDPVAVQSPPAMVQATGVRLSPAINREEQPTNRVRKVKLLTSSRCNAHKPRVKVTPFPQTFRTLYTISPP